MLKVYIHSNYPLKHDEAIYTHLEPGTVDITIRPSDRIRLEGGFHDILYVTVEA